jgi:hypothetical protein
VVKYRKDQSANIDSIEYNFTVEAERTR